MNITKGLTSYGWFKQLVEEFGVKDAAEYLDVSAKEVRSMLAAGKVTEDLYMRILREEIWPEQSRLGLDR